jgi:ElaB/YqjD/DUF883 family membrane-anchored ribosome-binding protein
MSTTHKSSHPDAADVFASDLGELKENFGQLRADVNQLVKGALESGHSGAKAVRQTAANAVEGLKESASDSLDSLGEWVTERPLTSTMIALSAGFILAKWMSRR